MTGTLRVRQQSALEDLEPWLLRHRAGLISSYTNLIGPGVGEIDDHDVILELEAIEAFCVHFGIEFPSRETVLEDR